MLLLASPQVHAGVINDADVWLRGTGATAEIRLLPYGPAGAGLLPDLFESGLVISLAGVEGAEFFYDDGALFTASMLIGGESLADVGTVEAQAILAALETLSVEGQLTSTAFLAGLEALTEDPSLVTDSGLVNTLALLSGLEATADTGDLVSRAIFFIEGYELPIITTISAGGRIAMDRNGTHVDDEVGALEVAAVGRLRRSQRGAVH
jgi:hypothetical protein